MHAVLLLLLYTTSTLSSILLPRLQFPGYAQRLNISGDLNAPSDIFPYQYDIPNSPFHLNLGLSHPRQTLDFQSLRRTIFAAQTFITMWSEQYGSNEPLRQLPGREDIFYFSAGEGITISITEGHYAITWGIVADVVRGLKEYLVDGRKPYVTRFEFTVLDMPVFGFGMVKERRGS